MATDRQKEAARQNIAKARQAQSARSHGAKMPRRGEGMSTAEENKLPGKQFARHVRNAIARFDQVEGVSDAQRDRAWERILAAAERYDVEVSASNWRDLATGGKDRSR